MSDRAMTWAADQLPRGPFAADVLLVLANAHTEGGLALHTREIARRAGIGLFEAACTLYDLRAQRLIDCHGIGGEVSVVLGLDFATDDMEALV